MKREWSIYKKEWQPKLADVEFNPMLKDVNGNGIVPTVVVNYFDGRFMMFGFMNEEAFNASKEVGRVVFWSVSDQELSLSGERKFSPALLITRWEKDNQTNSLIVYASPQ